MTFVYIDTETLGLDAERHPIWEVALITETEEWEIQFGVDVSVAEEAALRLNGFYERADLALGPHEARYRVNGGEWCAGMTIQRASIYGAIAKMTANTTLVGACPWFDSQRLDLMLRRNGYAGAWDYRLLDVQALAAGHLHAPLQGMAKTYAAVLGKEPPPGQHSALVDARMAKEVHERILLGGVGDVIDGWNRSSIVRAMAGEHVSDFNRRLPEVAKRTKGPVVASHNDKLYVVYPGDTVDMVNAAFTRAEAWTYRRHEVLT